MTAVGPQRALFGAALAVGLGAVGAALYTQQVMDMQPCPWCVLQRLEFLAIALVALPGVLLRARLAQRVAAGLMLLLGLTGVATALWQHFVAASSTSCNLTLADQIVRGLGLDELWPAVFAAYASCADAATRLLGVPYEFWSLLLFAALAAAAVLALRRA